MDKLYRLLRTHSETSSLGPEDIHVVVAAYEAAVSDLKIKADEAAIRESVASHIIEDALLGERDPIRLRDRALAQLRTKLARSRTT
jgi:hypothetical protein